MVGGGTTWGSSLAIVGGEDVFVWGGGVGFSFVFFRKEASAFSPLFYWTFGTFGPFLNPIFLGVFLG
jgi:hypothetical protein